MRKIILLSTVLFLSALSINAQIKVSSEGYVNIRNATPRPDSWGYEVMTKAYAVLFTPDDDSRYLRFQLGTSNPRISGTGDCVVFFDGQNSVFNDIQVRNVYNYSDWSSATNVLPISNALEKVKYLNPVSFDYTNTTPRKNAAGAHLQELGFMAQAVEQVLPEAVIEDEENHKLVNYSAIIPVLAASINELSEQIELLESELALLRASNGTTALLQTGNTSGKSQLFQNIPNPATGATTIKYYIPSIDSSASICIFDLQGKLLLTKTISAEGENEINIKASELEAGMYLYSLIVDNQLIDTKRMVLTR